MTFALLLAACTPVENVSTALTEGCVDCRIGDESQTLIEPSLSGEVVAAQAGADVAFDWSGLRKDVYGRDVSWSDDQYEAWLVSSLTRSLSELVIGMVSESLDQASLALFVTCLSDDAACKLSEFRLLDGAADVKQRFATSEESWGLVVVNPRDGGLAAVVEIVPTLHGGLSEVTVDHSAALQYEADLAEVAPLQVRANEPALQVDWSDVSTESLGATMVPGSADELFVIRSSLSRAELAAHVYDLAAVADARWTMPLGHTTQADLGKLTGIEPFNGIDSGSTWVLGLQCSGCSTPAPRLLTVLEAAN